ncbi:protein kinase domain-containing protein [Sorangium sp. So ce1000]|uniref:serine/threonine-protein kinase n=1 Tax=Sorangium sp. So ce1000 TaxID=3133325 RepID=UPI003F606C7E
MIPIEPGMLLANRFAIEHPVGSGGMGVVYRARDTFTSEVVALKLLRGEGGAGLESERFLREATLLSELRHPGIVAYVAHGQTPGGQQYLAMEWLDGLDLAERLARGPLALRDGLRLLGRVAEALSVAHARGVIHRDIKPSNVFLPAGDVERAKLLDFGVARPADGVMTRSGTVLGTPAYMAPEQARARRDLTPAADVFALGCLLYECLAGEPPFAADHVMAVMVRILCEEPAPIRDLRPEIPDPVAALLSRMLAKEAADRPSDAAEVARAIAALGDMAAAALPPTLIDQPAAAGAFAQREQALFSVVVAAEPEEAGDATLSEAEQLGAEERDSALRLALASLGARVDELPGGALVVTVPDTGSATDQASAAARAALQIKSLWPERAVSLATGRGAKKGRTAVGEVVDRAVRGLKRAPVGAREAPESGVRIDDLSAQLLGPCFVVGRTDEGAILSGEDRGADVSRPLLGKPTPCVGRDAELGHLEAQLAACIEEPEARAVVITAGPGMGKSRLRHELSRRVADRDRARRERALEAGEPAPAPVLVALGRGDLGRAGAAYGILASAVNELCGIGGSEPLEERRCKLRERVGRRVAPGEIERVAVFLGELCGVPFPHDTEPSLRAAREDPRLLRDRVRRAFLDWLSAECAAAPVLLLLDDLHWGDALSVALIDEALRELRDAPLFVVALGRPELQAAFPKLWHAHKPDELVLRGLAKRACERLVGQALGPQVDAQTMSRLIELSAGNALFLEELIRAVAEGRKDDHPETVLAMLQARIGRLDAGPRRAVRAAAVFGSAFWSNGVAAVLGRGASPAEVEAWLSALVEAELVEPRQASRLAGEEELVFRHALMREAAYSLLDDRDRSVGHAAASWFLERAGEADARVIAEHAERAGDRARALDGFARAAEQAFERHDLEGALSAAERACAHDPEGAQLGRLSALRSSVRFWANDWLGAFEVGQRALALLPAGNSWWSRTLSNLILVASNLPQVEPLHALCDALGAADPLAADPAPFAVAAGTAALQLGIAGDRARSRALLSFALRACDRLSPADVGARGYLDCARGWQAHFAEADPGAALASAARGSEALRSVQDLRNMMAGTLALGIVQGELGDPSRGLDTLRELCVLGERLNEHFFVFGAKTYMAHLLGQSPSDATEAEALALIAEVKLAPIPAPRAIARLAEAHLALRRAEAAPAGSAARAEASALSETSARAVLTDLPWLVPFRLSALAVLADALRAQHRAADAVAAIEEGLRLLADRGGTGFVEVPLRLAAAEAFSAAGQRERAAEELRGALREIDRRAATLEDPALREGYLERNPFCARARRRARELGLSEG